MDAGNAIHPDYVEGQMQAGAVQGIGWALNEEYVQDKDGRLQSTIFLDYRVPVTSDLPMIDCVIVEAPKPGHPFGVRGVGETSIMPPLAAIANAFSTAMGVRQTQLPISPRVLMGIKEKKPTIDVQLWASLKSLADGQSIVTIEASDIREMLGALV